MSGSNRGKFIVTGIALLLSAIIGFYLWQEASGYEAHYQIEAKEQTNYQAETAKEQAEIACKSVTPIKPCIDQNTKSDRPSQRSEQDLVAQQTMAAWTKAMGKAAIIGMIIGIIGVFLIWQTWAETRKAADNSRKTYDAYVAVERPRISLIVDRVWRHDTGYGCSLKAVNFGKTDCILTRFAIQSGKHKGYRPGIELDGTQMKTIVKVGEEKFAGHLDGIDVRNDFIMALVHYRSAFGIHKSYVVVEIYRTPSGDYAALDVRNYIWPEDT